MKFFKRIISIFFLRVLLGNFDCIQEHFLTFWKDKILSIFFPNFILDENFFCIEVFILSQISKKKGYQYNWRQLTSPPFCITLPCFSKCQNFPLCFSKETEKKIVTSSFFIFPKIVRRGDQGVVVFNYTDCLKENFSFPISVENWQKIFDFRSVKPDKIYFFPVFLVTTGCLDVNILDSRG